MQSSWTKQPIEDDSSQAASPICHVADCPSSVHAHVNRPIAESSSNKRVHITAKMEDQEEEKSGNEFLYFLLQIDFFPSLA